MFCWIPNDVVNKQSFFGASRSLEEGSQRMDSLDFDGYRLAMHLAPLEMGVFKLSLSSRPGSNYPLVVIRKFIYISADLRQI